jgi:phosphatidylglycerophosphate synthase
MNYMLFIVGIALFIRYSCDCLDGAVARKYKKVSDVGGLLDTIADNTLIFIVVLSIGKLATIPYYWLIAVTITLLNLFYLCRMQLQDHPKLKLHAYFHT